MSTQATMAVAFRNQTTVQSDTDTLTFTELVFPFGATSVRAMSTTITTTEDADLTFDGVLQVTTGVTPLIDVDQQIVTEVVALADTGIHS